MPKEYQMYMNGEWVRAASGKTFDDYNPFTGEVFAKVPSGGREDAKRAIAAADVAFPAWSHTPPAERLDSGMAHINDSSIHDEPQVPFGGGQGERLGEARRSCCP